MVVIVPTNEAARDLQGLHLFHGDISNCSMRVRMTLSEKGLDWVSHHLDLRKKENISEAYFGINPKGLVPTLVHDGVVHVESNDIIDYLDETFPNPPLRDRENAAAIQDWLRLATSIHVTAIKPYVYATKMQNRVKKTAEEQARYDALQTNEELKRFHAKHAGAAAFSEDDLAKSRTILAECFGKLEAALEGRAWINGDRFTLADIAWGPVCFVLTGCGYPFSRYPNIQRWARALEQRPSYRDGITDWCPDFSKV